MLTPSVSTEITVVAIAESPVSPTQPASSSTSPARSGPAAGALFRILPDGASDLLWESREDLPYDVAFEPGGEYADAAGADISHYLARHGVKATTLRDVGPDVGVGERILSRAADGGADLIVMGGYGRSRLRELVLGGATRSVLQSMTVPVLMAH